jgi:hypothetical protein
MVQQQEHLASTSIGADEGEPEAAPSETGPVIEDFEKHNQNKTA